MTYVLRTIVALVFAWISTSANAAAPSEDTVLGVGGPAGSSFESLSKTRCLSTPARSCSASTRASDETWDEEPIAASAIPEPEVNALMLGGLGAIVFMALRRHRE